MEDMAGATHANGIPHVDVIVVGAGLSGIGAGWHLQKMCPDRSYLILEGRDSIGGTWDLFRYPGVRSDSDMHTLGYSFKPWVADQSIADGPAILDYVKETAREFGIDRHIRFGQQVEKAEWSTPSSTWTLTTKEVKSGTTRQLSCNFLFMCSGYYSYRGGYDPEFVGRERFKGSIVHPQKWPSALDYAGKRVVVIGSGATAMTLVPAMARDAAHVTMLQRSPTYVVARPDVDILANRLRKWLPSKLAYRITRKKNTAFQQLAYKRTRSHPEKVREYLIGEVKKALPDYDVDTHFTPKYNPWDQRLCLLPNGDLFEAIKQGQASVVTDTIASLDETGIMLTSGQHLDADIIVTATGLNLVTLGEVAFAVDGQPVDFAKSFTYKGLAYSDVPNLATSFGYVNASWTLRADLTCEYVCRLLNHMRNHGATQCTPRLRATDAGMPERPWMDIFTPNYMQRVMHLFPRQGDREPWINPQNYKKDKKMFQSSPVDDGVMTFT